MIANPYLGGAIQRICGTIEHEIEGKLVNGIYSKSGGEQCHGLCAVKHSLLFVREKKKND